MKKPSDPSHKGPNGSAVPPKLAGLAPTLLTSLNAGQTPYFHTGLGGGLGSQGHGNLAPDDFLSARAWGLTVPRHRHDL